MAKHTITISVRDGKFSYTGDPVGDPIVARRGDKVAWVCNDGHFAVHLGWSTPCEKGRYRASRGQALEARVRKDAGRGAYKYSVAVSVDNRIWTDDPQIIIPE